MAYAPVVARLPSLLRRTGLEHLRHAPALRARRTGAEYRESGLPVNDFAHANPLRTAHSAACVRSVTPIFVRICCT